MGLIIGVTVLTNSINVETSIPFKFNNPIALNTSESNQEKIIKKRPLMVDRDYSLKLFGLKIPLVTYRTVQDPSSIKTYSGRLDKEGNIHTPEGIYELQFAHDSNWYRRK